MDSGPALSYTLLLEGDTADTFGVLRYGGHIALTGPLDHEQRSRYTLTLRASDTRHETEANLTVLVEDVNDNVPTFTQVFYQVHAPGVPASRDMPASPLQILPDPPALTKQKMGLSPFWFRFLRRIYILAFLMLSLWHRRS